ncbi:hypothetical protein ACFO1B_39370 [Dactylosporangium siamense]|uniref:Polysaccharide chain length determinant N-terminal domain-containing protein n=1 Tax=Dactylosporangium siamense TaxID=685454 RepID=A0A919PX58_9ACTN|nr:hypothetical protein [Dactylosporangium siamense]GIG50258.1 hypothetical protein Dsi01nite_082990 [Dactylosporangium siamense]
MATDSLVERLQFENASEPPAALSRWQIMWRSKYAIGGVAAVIAVATWATASFLPENFQASSDVLIGGRAAAATMDSVGGMNSLATQYAHLATTTPVLDEAARRAGTTAKELVRTTTVATVANTNIVRVTVAASSASVASRRAEAVAGSLSAFVGTLRTGKEQANADRLKELDALLVQAKNDVTAARSALLGAPSGSSAAQLANTLLNNAEQQVMMFTLKRVDLINQMTNESTAHDVSLTVLTPGGSAQQTGPRPLRSAVIALLLSLVVLAELAVFSERRRNPVNRARRHRPVLFG